MKNIILSSIGTATFFIVLCLPFFIHYPMNDNYLLLYPISLGIGVVAAVACIFSFIKGNGFRFCLPDYLFLTLVAYYIVMTTLCSLPTGKWPLPFFPCPFGSAHASFCRTVLFPGNGYWAVWLPFGDCCSCMVICPPTTIFLPLPDHSTISVLIPAT